HIRIEQAEITNRVGGYETWKVKAVVVESFKGTFKNGDVIEYFHSAEAGFKREYFTRELIVFLLAESEDGKPRYTTLENSSLFHSKDRVRKLRLIKNKDNALLRGDPTYYGLPWLPVAAFASVHEPR
ncbi:MAG TPA: hypothetical protein VF435_13890, partial [Pyrinomonadaceae bacterium]